jgi:carboxypeptidase family protein
MGMRRVCAASLAVVLNGCIALPIAHDRLAAPVVEGRVIDARTSSPIPGAEISVIADGTGVKGLVRSDAEGRFRISGVERGEWMVLVLLAPYEGFCGGKYTVAHDLYKPLTFQHSYFGPANFNGVCSASVVVKQDVQLEPK